MKRHSFLWMVCILMCLSFMIASQSMAQCSMTSAGLDAAMQSCGAGDLDCFVALAGSNPSCAGNIAWFYMLLNNPDNPEMVLNRFSATVPSAYTDELTASINEAYRVNQVEQKAGSSTSDNEYPFGQGNPYGK
jgi:hypothetical protein